MTLESDNARLRKMLQQSAKDWDTCARVLDEVESVLTAAQRDKPKYVIAQRVGHALYLLCAHDFNVGPQIRDGLKQMEEAPCEKTD